MVLWWVLQDLHILTLANGVDRSLPIGVVLCVRERGFAAHKPDKLTCRRNVSWCSVPTKNIISSTPILFQCVINAQRNWTKAFYSEVVDLVLEKTRKKNPMLDWRKRYTIYKNLSNEVKNCFIALRSPSAQSLKQQGFPLVVKMDVRSNLR